MRRGTIALILIVLAGPAWAEAPSVVARFPGAETRALDPTGRYAVVWVAADQTRQGAHHELLLEEVASGRTRPLRAFERWAIALWAPNGRRLAVTAGVGSDRSEVWVYIADEPAVPVDAWQVLEVQSKGGLGFAAGADHRFVEAVRWRDEATLVVRIWGYGGPKPFDRQLDMRLGE
jgi:hypothetical protein